MGKEEGYFAAVVIQPGNRGQLGMRRTISEPRGFSGVFLSASMLNSKC